MNGLQGIGPGAARDATRVTPAMARESTSSTTRDTPSGPTFLSLPKTLAFSGGIGIALGALLLRSPGAGWSLGALGSGAWKGAALGASLGGLAVGADRITDGEMNRQLDLIALDRRAQLWFALSNLTKPWLAGMGLGVMDDARAAQRQLYGGREPLDGPHDAFRHAYASALFVLRAMRDHGVPRAEAAKLAIEAGEANEVDGQDNNDEHSRSMDFANNLAGIEVVGDGRARAGEAADPDGFVTEAALRARIVDALAGGRLQVVVRTGSEPSARPTVPRDLPPNFARRAER